MRLFVNFLRFFLIFLVIGALHYLGVGAGYVIVFWVGLVVGYLANDWVKHRPLKSSFTELFGSGE